MQWVLNKIKKGWKWITGIFVVTALAATMVGGTDTNTVPTLNFNGENKIFAYTDENAGENLLIEAVTSTVGGFGGASYEFSITNNSGQDDFIDIQFYLEGDANVATLYELRSDVEYTRSVPKYGLKNNFCLAGWQATTTLRGDFYQCENSVLKCDSVSGQTCTQDKVRTGVREEPFTIDEWQALVPSVGKRKNTKAVVPQTHDIKKATRYWIGDGETSFFKADLTFTSGLRSSVELKQFFIEAVGVKGGYGILDPWFDSDFGFCRPITITAGGNLDGVATTSLIAYTIPIPATTTLATLAGTADGGNVEFLDGRDIIYTNGTDCNTTSGTLIDYYHQRYNPTDGEIVSIVEVAFSSTTDTVFLQYYGNSAAVDQSDEAGTYNSSYSGYWNMDENPANSAPQILDSTSANHDGTVSTNITGADWVDGILASSTDFDSASDSISFPDSADWDLTAGLTICAWVNGPNENGDYQAIVNRANGGNNDWEYGLLGSANAGSRRPTFYSDSGGELISPTDVTANEWTQVCITRRSSSPFNRIVYVDGIQRALNTTSPGIANTSNPLIMGDANFDQGYNGFMDEVYVKSEADHAMDILTTYNCTAIGCTTFGAEETEVAGEAGGTPNFFIKGSMFIKGNVFKK